MVGEGEDGAPCVGPDTWEFGELFRGVRDASAEV